MAQPRLLWLRRPFWSRFCGLSRGDLGESGAAIRMKGGGRASPSSQIAGSLLLRWKQPRHQSRSELGGKSDLPVTAPGTREMVISRTPYFVAYRIAGDDVEILAVLHGAWRWPESF